MNTANVIALALILLGASPAREIQVQAAGQSVRIRAQAPKQYLGEPLRIDDGTGWKACSE